jgi:hypothetical protein
MEKLKAWRAGSRRQKWGTLLGGVIVVVSIFSWVFIYGVPLLARAGSRALLLAGLVEPADPFYTTTPRDSRSCNDPWLPKYNNPTKLGAHP